MVVIDRARSAGLHLLPAVLGLAGTNAGRRGRQEGNPARIEAHGPVHAETSEGTGTMVHGSIVGVSWAYLGPSVCELGGRRPSNQTVGQNKERLYPSWNPRLSSIGLPFQSCFVLLSLFHHFSGSIT